MHSAGKHDFLHFHDLTPAQVMQVLDRAEILANAWAAGALPPSLKSRRIALIVDDTGWRNTTAFDLGIQAMGGLCVKPPIGLGRGEDIADLAAYLDNWFDAVICRTPELASLKALAAAAAAPVINARTRANHPCETLGDLAYVKARRGSVDGVKIAAVAPDGNILASWLEAARVLPVSVVQIYAAPWQVANVTDLGPNVRTSTDLRKIEDADVIITDCWPAGADENALSPYRISGNILDRCKPDLIFLPCPPVARGQEVTADAMLHAACQSPAAKAYLLHAQNALLEWVLKVEPA